MWCWLFTAQPALYGWYLADEPDGAGDVEGPPVGVQPETVQAAYDLVKELDPHHPVLLSLNCMHSAPYYQVRSDRRRRWGAVCCAASRSSLPSFSARRQSGHLRFKWLNTEPRDSQMNHKARPPGGFPSAWNRGSPSIEMSSQVHTRTVRGAPNGHAARYPSIGSGRAALSETRGTYIPVRTYDGVRTLAPHSTQMRHLTPTLTLPNNSTRRT